MEWNDQLCFPELFRSCLALPANCPRFPSAAAVEPEEIEANNVTVSASGMDRIFGN